MNFVYDLTILNIETNAAYIMIDTTEWEKLKYI